MDGEKMGLFISLPIELKRATYVNYANNLVYYFHVYTPKDYLWKVSPKRKDVTYMMWAFKDTAPSLIDGQSYTPDYKKDVVKKFTYELVTAISELSKHNFKTKGIKNIVLLAIPPSKVNKNSTIRSCVLAIVDVLLKDNSSKKKYLDSKTLLDGGSVLKRIKDVETTHLTGKSNTYEDLMNSLTVDKTKLPRGCKSEETAFIILDDVVTTGLNMKVCKDLLTRTGIQPDKIVCLAIAKTERP